MSDDPTDRDGRDDAVRVEVVRSPDAGTVATVVALAESAATSDGTAPLSEQTLLRLRHGGADSLHVLVRDSDDALLGYAFLDLADDPAPTGELVVAPAARRRGHGRRLVERLLQESPRGVRLWAHGDLPGAAELGAALGLRPVRTLLQLRRPFDGAAPALAEPAVPSGVTVRTFVPGQDDEAWLAVNAAAFAHHPEQGRWTRDDLRERIAEPWFDPAGFFLAERDGEVVGFHWTKVHTHDDERVGEVYVVGVRPDQQGTGLGRALTLVGLRHLRDTGLPAVTLYVEADNAAALSLYTALGFQPWHRDVVLATA